MAIVHTSWHRDIVDKLVDGAKRACLEQGIKESNIVCFEVAGSFELSQMVSHLAGSQKYGAIIPLGCLIKGETIHFEVIAQTITDALDEIGRRSGIPVSLGVITVNSKAQALERCGGKEGHKGYEAAIAAIQLAQHFFTQKQ
ncbi:MAG: 6,7-dimethyl-8-ribityllumazine synthase [Bdellovibrionales bacterium]|nr:6,7-dimethyl-8-ribityllumazine synthase [Bdellovibrionales bacterium]